MSNLSRRADGRCAPGCTCSRHRKCPEGCTCGLHRKCQQGCTCHRHNRPKCPEGCDCPRHTLKPSQMAGKKCLPGCECARHRIPECSTGCTCGKHRPNPVFCRPGCECLRHSAESRAKISATHKGKPKTQKFRELVAQMNRERNLSKEPTNLERGLYWILASAGVKFEREVRFGRYVVDAYDPVTRTAYEADGAYWHDAKKDALRDAELLASDDVYVLRFTERDLWACAS